jgi:predicted PP-loop superfamily ATPase
MRNKGLGDTVSSIIRGVSRGKIKECGRCNKRKELLNKNVDYKKINEIFKKWNII